MANKKAHSRLSVLFCFLTNYLTINCLLFWEKDGLQNSAHKYL
jgi:hypothetical protein